MTVSDGIGWAIMGGLIGYLWNRERTFAKWLIVIASFGFFVKYFT